MKIFLLSLSVFIVGAFSFFLLGVLNPEVEYREGKTIHASAEKVFEIYFHPDKQQYWLPGFKSVEVLTKDTFAIGSRFKFLLNIKGKERILIQELKEFDAYKNIIWTWEEEGLLMEHRLSLYDFGTHTKVEVSGKVMGKSWQQKSLNTLYAYYFKTLHRSLLKALDKAVLVHKFDK